MAVEHASTLKKLMGILLLMKKETVRTPNDLNAKEIMESTQVLDSELVTQPESNLLKNGCGGGCQDDVIDVKQQICSRVTVAIDKQ